MDDLFVRIATMAGIAPTAYHARHKWARYAQTTLLASAASALTCYHVVVPDTANSSLSVMSVIVKLLATLMIANVAVRINVLQHDEFQEMRTLFATCSRLLASQMHRHQRQRIPLKAFVVFATLAALEYCEIFIWHPAGPDLRIAYQAILHLYVLIVNALTWSILKDLRVRLECLNAAVAEFPIAVTLPTIALIPKLAFQEAGPPKPLAADEVAGKRKQRPHVQLWCRVHMLSNKLAASYNRIFGWHIFLLMIYVMLILLMPLLEFLQYQFTLNVDAMNLILLTAFQIMEMVMIVKQCDKVVGAARHTTLMAYEAMHQCSEEGDRKDVIRFAQQTGTQFAHFSAAGFFVVDNSALFTMMQLITTYVIVMIQFQDSRVKA